jgi:hypothetical protein
MNETKRDDLYATHDFCFKTYKNYITLDDVSGHYLGVWLVMFNIFNETFQLLIKIKSKRFL